MKKIVLAIALIVFLVSCEKQAEQKTADQLLTENPWLFAKWEEKTNNGPWIDNLPNADPCETDAQTIFRADNTYEINEGATNCDPNDPFITDAGTWTFINNGAGVQFWGDDFALQLLNDNMLVISRTYSRPGIAVEERITYKH
jgi:uncharacterized lipoprotein NlpE involved in copper resistance